MGATFFGLNTLSCMAGTVSVLLARRAWNWGRLVRERRVRRMSAYLDAQLSQVVVEEVEEVPLAEVLPNTGALPRGRRGSRKVTPPTPKKVLTPRRSNLNRRLSAVWADQEVVSRFRVGVKTRSQSSLESMDSFKSMEQ